MSTKFHGIELAKNSVFANLVIESLATDPVIDSAGRVWLNNTTGLYKFSVSDGQGGYTVKVAATVAELQAAIAAYDAKLASTTSGQGSGLVGYAGKAGTNGKVTVNAGTVEGSIDTLVVAADAAAQGLVDMDARVDILEANVGGAMGDLATLTTDAKDTVVAAINEVDAAINAEVTRATTAEQAEVTRATAAEAAIQAEVDALETDVATNYVKKTGTEAQTVNPDMVFEGTVRFNGDILQQGPSKIVMGEEVLFEDNIVILNSNMSAEDAPTEDAGWGVNRGNKGELVVIKWDETNDVVKGVKSVDAAGVATYDTFAFDSELLAVEAALDARLDVLEANVGGAMGDLATLTTDAKDTVVAAINEVDGNHDTYVAAVAASTGSGLVGYAGKAGANSKLTVAAGTVAQSFDAVVAAVDTDRQAFADRVAAEGSTTAGQGSGLIGYVGKAGANSKFTVNAGTTEAAINTLVTAIDNDRLATEVRQSDVASTTAGKGTGLVGFSGQTGTNSKFSVAAGTAENAIKAIISEVDAVKFTLDNSSSAIDTRIDNLVTAVNATKYKTTSASALEHTITHNLNSTEISVMTWVKDGSVWKNHIIGVTIVDANTVRLNLTEAYEVKCLVEKFDNITA